MKKLLWIPAIITLTLLWSPLLLIVKKGASSEAIKALMQRGDIWTSFTNSLLLALAASVTATIFGTLCAFYLKFSKAKSKTRTMRTLSFPMLLPEIALGLSQMAWFMTIGFSLGWTTLYLGHLIFLFSYATWIMSLRTESLEWSMVDAARDLGADSLSTFKVAILPQLAPSLLTSTFTCFALSLDDFLISFFVKGLDEVTLPIQIYGMLKLRLKPEIFSLSLFLFCISLSGILFAKVCQKFFGSKKTFSRQPS